MAYIDRDEWADDHGYVRGRCACGRRTWSDTGVMDCGCGASLDALAEEEEEWEARRQADLAEQEAEEALECECIMTGDLADASGCELHGGAF